MCLSKATKGAFINKGVRYFGVSAATALIFSGFLSSTKNPINYALIRLFFK